MPTFSKSGVWDKVPKGSTLIFGDTQIFYNSLGYVEGSLHTKTSSIRPAVSIQYQLVTDGRTDGRTDGHMMTAYTMLAYRRTVKTTYSETTLSVDYKPALNLGHAL